MKAETNEVCLLQHLYQNARQGEETLCVLKKRLPEGALRASVDVQIRGYRSLRQKAAGQLRQKGLEPQEAGLMTKTMSQMMTRLHAMQDPSPTHAAEMIIQGSTMGIVGATEDLNQYQGGGQPRKLADEVIHFEQENIERMKAFL